MSSNPFPLVKPEDDLDARARVMLQEDLGYMSQLMESDGWKRFVTAALQPAIDKLTEAIEDEDTPEAERTKAVQKKAALKEMRDWPQKRITAALEYLNKKT